MPSWAREVLKYVTPAVTTALLGYCGLVVPGQESKKAQDSCCPIARVCVERLGGP